MQLEQIAKLIEVNNIAQRGKNLFIHFMPADVRRGIVILPSLAGNPINWELPGWNKTNSFQVLVRDADVQDGLAVSASVVKCITILKDTVFPAIPPNILAINVRYIRPRHDTVVMPRSPSNYFEFSTNFEAAYNNL